MITFGFMVACYVLGCLTPRWIKSRDKKEREKQAERQDWLASHSVREWWAADRFDRLGIKCSEQQPYSGRAIYQPDDRKWECVCGGKMLVVKECPDKGGVMTIFAFCPDDGRGAGEHRFAKLSAESLLYPEAFAAAATLGDFLSALEARDVSAIDHEITQLESRAADLRSKRASLGAGPPYRDGLAAPAEGRATTPLALVDKT